VKIRRLAAALACAVGLCVSAPLPALALGPDEGGKEPAGEEAAREEPAESFNFADIYRKHPRPFVASLVNFAILLLIYYGAGKKPILSALAERRKSIAKEIEEANRLKQEAETRAKQYQAKLTRLDEELAQAKQALIEAGEGEKERIIKDAEEKAARMRKDAEFLVEQEAKQIRQDLWRDTVDVAVGAAEELLRRRITQADQQRIAEDYLADLARATRATQPPAGPGGGAE
jgi:F-type H+-transporting ATPase subunit b